MVSLPAAQRNQGTVGLIPLKHWSGLPWSLYLHVRQLTLSHLSLNRES